MGYKLYIIYIITLLMASGAYAQLHDGDAVQAAATVSIDPTIDVQVIVDRNPRVQQMKVYKRGVLSSTYTVSTGRERFEFPGHGTDAYCTDTPLVTEELTPAHRLRELYRSNTWKHELKDAQGRTILDPAGVPMMEGSAMGFAMFFHQGVATHVAPPGSEGQLGTPASGGCVRMTACDAEELFDMVAVRETGSNAAFNRSNCGKDAYQYDTVNPNGDQRQDGTFTQNPMCKPTSSTVNVVDNGHNNIINIFQNGQRQQPQPAVELPSFCTDSKQWPVHHKNQRVVVSVVDSRPQAEQACVKSKCDVQMNKYKADRKACLLNKMRPAFGAAVDSPNFNLSASLEGIGADQSKAFREACNIELEAQYKTTPMNPVCDASGVATLNGEGGSPAETVTPPVIAPAPLDPPANTTTPAPAPVNPGSEKYQRFLERMRQGGN